MVLVAAFGVGVASLGLAGSASAASTEWTYTFVAGSYTTFSVPQPPSGMRWAYATVSAQGAAGGNGATGNLGGYGAAGNAKLTSILTPGTQLLAIVGTNGAVGDPSEQNPAIGGWPGGGSGVEGGGGGGGFTALCPPGTSVDSAEACEFVLAGGGGAGGQANTAGLVGSGGSGEVAGGQMEFGDPGQNYGGAGGGDGATFTEAGMGGTASGEPGSEPGSPGENASGSVGGNGGLGGTTGGGGGGGGGGINGGDGGGGGGSCDSCDAGYAGGGGGAAGGSKAGLFKSAYNESPDQGGILVIQWVAENSLTQSSGPPTAEVGVAQTAVNPSSSNDSGPTVPVSCSGPAGASCSVALTLTATTTAQTQHGRRLAVSARKKKMKQRTIVVASAIVALEAGGTQDVTLALESQGRALLRKHFRLATKLTVRQTVSGRTRTVVSRKLTLRRVK